MAPMTAKSNKFVFEFQDVMSKEDIAAATQEASILLQRLIVLSLTNGVDLASQFAQMLVQGASTIGGAAALASRGTGPNISLPGMSPQRYNN